MSSALPLINRQTAETEPTPVDASLSADHLKLAIVFLLVYFGIRLVYLTFNVSSYVPPDEVTHAGLCRIFSKHLFFPANSPQTFEFGLVTNIPWLYYWTMGKLLHLNIFGFTDLVFLRLMNIPLAFGTVLCVRKTLLILTDDRLSQILVVVAITNTAMFSLLSSSVSYDNMANLLATMAIYYLFSFFKERSAKQLFASILCQMGGCLTKVTFLPLALAMALLLAAFEWRNLRGLPTAVKNYFRIERRQAWLYTLVLLIALGLNLQLYAGNYFTYGTLTPEMTAVVPPSSAMQYRITARETIFRLYTENKISYMEALMMAGDIQHPGDKSDTFYLLMNYENLKRNPELWMGPLRYSKVWLDNVAGSIFGIKGHLQMYKSPVYLLPIYSLLALSFLSFALRWRPRHSGWLPPCLAAIACCYTGYIMYKVNYNAYLHYGTPGVTLQGRYLFPVIGPIYVLLSFYLVQLFAPGKIRLGLTLATILLLIVYDFPWFLMHTIPQWYEWMPR